MEWRNLSDPLFEHAVSHPEAVALVAGGRRWTYRALADLVGKASVYLHDLGLEPGEPIGIGVPGGIEHVLLILGLLRLGAVPIELPSSVPSGTRAAGWQQCGVRRFILPAEATVVAADGCIRLPRNWLDRLRDTTGDRRVSRDADEPAMLHPLRLHDGSPGAIVTSRRQWVDRVVRLQRLLPEVLTTERPPSLVLAGTRGQSALLFLFAQLHAGGSIILSDSSDVEQMASVTIAAGDAVVLLSPELCRQLVALPDVAGRRFPRLRALFVGATALFPHERRMVTDRLTPNCYAIHANAAYGVGALLTPQDVGSAACGVGRPDPALDVQIVDGGERPQAPGAMGRVRLRGPGVADTVLGGTDDPAAEAGFRNGWYYPDEVGQLQPDGFLRLTGRASRMVRRRGTDVFLPGIERILQAHAAVDQAAAVGIATDGADAPRIVAFVVLRDGAPAEVVEACRDKFPAGQAPDRVHIVSSLPRTDRGLPDFRQLLASVTHR